MQPNAITGFASVFVKKIGVIQSEGAHTIFFKVKNMAFLFFFKMIDAFGCAVIVNSQLIAFAFANIHGVGALQTKSAIFNFPYSHCAFGFVGYENMFGM